MKWEATKHFFYGPIRQIWPLLIRYNIASRISWCEVKQVWLISFLVAWCLLFLLNRYRNISQRCYTVEENKESAAVCAISAGTFRMAPHPDSSKWKPWFHTEYWVETGIGFKLQFLTVVYVCNHNRDLVKYDVFVPSMTQIDSSARNIGWPNRLKRSFSIILIALWNKEKKKKKNFDSFLVSPIL